MIGLLPTNDNADFTNFIFTVSKIKVAGALAVAVGAAGGPNSVEGCSRGSGRGLPDRLLFKSRRGGGWRTDLPTVRGRGTSPLGCRRIPENIYCFLNHFPAFDLTQEGRRGHSSGGEGGLSPSSPSGDSPTLSRSLLPGGGRASRSGWSYRAVTPWGGVGVDGRTILTAA